jgi:predicted ATPase/DNA-binding SARP family transcriptional activator
LKHQTKAASATRDESRTTDADQVGSSHKHTTAPAPALSLRLLGDFLLSSGDEVMGISSARVQSLLAYLALHRDAGQTRQQLAFLFWPDSSEAQARNNLRQLVHQLRRMWPEADRWLAVDASRMSWRREVDLGLDVDAFEDALGRADQAERAGDASAFRRALVQTVAEYRADLLPACYDDWIASDRERLRNSYARALDRTIAMFEEQDNYASAIEHAQHRLRHDPLEEDGYRQLMRLHALNDDRVSALRVYHACASMLERELAVQPSPATRRAYEGLLSVDARPLSTPALASTLVATAPLVGRRREWSQLQSIWGEASAGAARFAVLSGDAGIGKSRLAEELLMWASRQGVSTARTRAYAAEGRLSYAPVVDWLRGGSLRVAVSRIDAVSLSEVARLLPELLSERPDVPPPKPLDEQWQRQHFFQSLARAALSTSQPLLLLLDDLQWCDQETLEWLHYLLRFDSCAPLLVVGTMRTEEVGPQDPLTTLLTDLRGAGQLTEILLGPLDAAETTELGMCVAGRSLAADEARRLYDETEGQPLFVVETVRAGLAAAEPASMAETDRSTLVGMPGTSQVGRLPPKVHAVIAARLAQLSDAAREVVRLAATIGRAFSLDLLVQACDDDMDRLVGVLDELWQRRIVREHGTSSYDFSHDKIREVAYAEMSAARRSVLHRRVALALEEVSVANLDTVSAQVATHYEQGGLPAQAVPYFQRAAGLAQRVYAHAEAIRLLNKGLAQLALLPASQARDATELELQTAFALALVATRGYGAPEAMTVYRRTRELCQQLGLPPSPPILRALAIASIAHTEFQQAHELGDLLLRLATRDGDAVLLVEGHYVLGVTLFWKGALLPSRKHLEQALAHYAPARLGAHLTLYSQDPRVVCLIRLAVDLWLLGYPRQAEQREVEALQLARERSHPFSLAYAQTMRLVLWTQRHEARATAEQAEACIALCREHGMGLWLAMATIMQGWALAEQGDVVAGIAQMRKGLAAFRASGNLHLGPFVLGLLAEQYGKIGYVERGLTLVSEALAAVERTGERWYEAELYRCRGVLLFARNDAGEAEVALQRALGIARYQAAKAIELRVATSLARLWRSQARYADGCQLLEDCCAWFDDGFATRDLIEARAVLAACREQSA